MGKRSKAYRKSKLRRLVSLGAARKTASTKMGISGERKLSLAATDCFLGAPFIPRPRERPETGHEKFQSDDVALQKSML